MSPTVILVVLERITVSTHLIVNGGRVPTDCLIRELTHILICVETELNIFAHTYYNYRATLDYNLC